MPVTHGGASKTIGCCGIELFPARGKANSRFRNTAHGYVYQKRIIVGSVTWPQRAVFVIWKVLAFFETMHCKPLAAVVLRWQSISLSASTVTEIGSRALESRQSHLTTSPSNHLRQRLPLLTLRLLNLANGRLAANGALRHDIGYHLNVTFTLRGWPHQFCDL